MIPPKYINPYTDFGFKKLFGEEGNKDLLKDFLNSFLPEQHQVQKLTFHNPDVLGTAQDDRRAVFDIYCQNEKKERFIVEMQKAEQEYFKDRSLFYTTHPIQIQARRGIWNFNLKMIYFIGILDFQYDKNEKESICIRNVALKDQNGVIFFDKLKMIYIQMPLFKKKESELATHQDKWLYFLKNLPSLEHIPIILNEKIFKKAFKTAEYAALPKKEQENYIQSQNDYWTYLATIETAEKKGIEIGTAQGIEIGTAQGIEIGTAQGIEIGTAQGEIKKAQEIARNMKNFGIDIATISKMTGLAANEINKLN